jgi:hypothetical protein
VGFLLGVPLEAGGEDVLAAWAELTTKAGTDFTLDGDHQLTRSAPAELAAVLTALALTATQAVRQARSDAPSPRSRALATAP